MSDTSKLSEVVEEVRQRDFPDLSAELVHSILEVQIRHQEDASEALKGTHAALRRHVESALKLPEPGESGP